MYLMYVDESGDVGLDGSPTTLFCLSGLVIHESQWRAIETEFVNFRRTLNAAYGLPIRDEIHASVYIKRPPISGMSRHIRLAILRNFLDELAKQNAISVTNVIVNKTTKAPGYDVFENAWKALFQRFENTLKSGNFPGEHKNDFGIVLTDATDGRKLQRLVRRMAVYNPVPNQSWAGPGYRNLPILRIIEDPHPKDSRDSYFIQACDVIAYFLHQLYRPNAFIRKRGAQRYLQRIAPIINMRAAPSNQFGIVEL